VDAVHKAVSIPNGLDEQLTIVISEKRHASVVCSDGQSEQSFASRGVKKPDELFIEVPYSQQLSGIREIGNSVAGLQGVNDSAVREAVERLRRAAD
jgi:hypothetical protein